MCQQKNLLKELLQRFPDLTDRQEWIESLGGQENPQSCLELLAACQDPASEIRQSALISLRPYPEATEAWLKALQDPDYIVRATAAELLGERKDPQTISALIDSLQDHEYMVRASAAEALGRMEAIAAIVALEQLLLDNDQWVRYSAAESLNQIQPEQNRWVLLMNANSADPSLRLEALSELLKSPDPRVLMSVVRMLKKAPEDTSLEHRLFEALSTLHHPQIIPALVELALYTDQGALREQALQQAQELDLDTCVNALGKWLNPDGHPYAQRAIEALRNLPHARTTPIFLAALGHRDRWVRTVSILTLEERKEPVPQEHLQALLTESAPDLAGSALRHLVRQPLLQSETELSQYSQSDIIWKRQLVAENLSQLSEVQQLTYVPLFLEDPAAEVREACLRSLGQSQIAQRDLYLQQGSQDEDAWVRQAATEGLGRNPNAQNQARLLEMLENEPDFLVRASVAEALGTYRGDAILYALKQTLEDDKPSVRLQAAHALLKQELRPEELRALLRASDKHVVLAALQYLRQFPQTELESEIADLLISEDLQIRSAAHHSLS